MDAVRQAAGLNGGQCVVDPGVAGRPRHQEFLPKKGERNAQNQLIARR
jgi:hypothetical protein